MFCSMLTTEKGLLEFRDKNVLRGLELVKADKYAAWLGRKPSANSSSISRLAKCSSYRIAGLETKFTHSPNLQMFKKKVEHESL